MTLSQPPLLRKRSSAVLAPSEKSAAAEVTLVESFDIEPYSDFSAK